MKAAPPSVEAKARLGLPVLLVGVLELRLALGMRLLRDGEGLALGTISGSGRPNGSGYWRGPEVDMRTRSTHPEHAHSVCTRNPLSGHAWGHALGACALGAHTHTTHTQSPLSPFPLKPTKNKQYA